MKKALLLQIAIVILGFSIYANSLQGEFIWDDNAFVKNNAYIKGWNHLPDIFTESTGFGAGYNDDFYRPLQIFTYLLDNTIWKGNISGYHLTNIILHILVGLSVYWVIILLFNNRAIAGMTSILFIAHPVQTEAVSYISGRGDLLSSLFMFLCFIFYIIQASTQDRRLFTLMLLSYILAILSKENAIIFPGLLLLYHYVFKKKIKFKLIVPIICIAFFYFLLRPVKTTALSFDFNVFLKRIPGFFVALTNYVKILFLPVNLHMEYGDKIFNLVDPKAIFGVAASFLLLIYVFKKKHANKLLIFSVCWFFIALLPHSSIYPVSAFYMAEHWLYFSSLGFFLIVAYALLLLYNKNNSNIFSKVSIISLIIILSFLSIRQNKYWNNQIAFYKRTLKYAPDSARVYNNLCQAYIEKANYNEALKACLACVEINSNYPQAYCNLGDAYKNLGNIRQAEAAYIKATKISPKFVSAYFRLGQLYASAGKSDEAIKNYEYTVKIDRNFVEAYNSLCELYLSINKNLEAAQICKKALQLNPVQANVYYNIGRAYDNIGENQKSIEAYSKAVEIDSGFLEAYNNLAARYADNGKIDKAIALWNKVIQIDPRFSMAHFNLAGFYFQQKKYDLAIQHCDKVTALGDKVDPVFLELLKPHRK